MARGVCSSRTLAALLCIAIATTFPRPAAADWRAAFGEGVRARDMGQWREAARHLRRALDENPEETGEKVRVYGMKWERYLPSYYLGMVLYEAGDCRGALEAFERSRDSGAVGLAGRTLRQDRESACRRRLGLPTDPTPRPAAPRPSIPGAGARVPPPPPVTPSPRRHDPRAVDPRPSPTPAPPIRPPSPPPSRPVQTTEEARREALRSKGQEAERSVRRAGQVAQALDAHLTRTQNTAFRTAPAMEARYQAAYRRLNNARFRLQAGRRESDLQAITQAGDEADAARVELEEIARALGVSVQ